MDRETRSHIVYLVNMYLVDERIKDLRKGEYDKLLTVDVDSIIRSFNDDFENPSILDNKEVLEFIEQCLPPEEWVDSIVGCKELLAYKTYFEDTMETSTLDGNDIFYDDGYNNKTSYKKVKRAMDSAEKVVKGDKIYQLLRFSLKYYNIVEQIEERKKLFETIANNPEKWQEIDNIIKNGSNNIGVVRISTSNYDADLMAGTLTEVAFSNLMGHYYDLSKWEINPSVQVTKVFHSAFRTPYQRNIILKEQKRRDKIADSIISDDVGYILNGDCGYMITKLDLLNAGIDPDKAGWKPICLVNQSDSSLKQIKACMRAYKRMCTDFEYMVGGIIRLALTK